MRSFRAGAWAGKRGGRREITTRSATEIALERIGGHLIFDRLAPFRISEGSGDDFPGALPVPDCSRRRFTSLLKYYSSPGCSKTIRCKAAKRARVRRPFGRRSERPCGPTQQ